MAGGRKTQTPQVCYPQFAQNITYVTRIVFNSRVHETFVFKKSNMKGFHFLGPSFEGPG